MNKRKIVFGAIFAVSVIFGLLYQSGAFLSEEAKELKEKENQIAKINKTEFAKLPRITLDELNKKITNKEDFIAYFGWVENCGDSRLFQLNSFDKYLENKAVKDKLFVIDLDKEAPKALSDKELRKPITEKFLINTWTKDASLSPMELKAPQIIHYKNGKIADLVSWTVINGDSKYGITPELTDAFFAKFK